MAREVSCVGEGSRTGDLGQDVRATRAPSLTLGGLHRWQLRALLFENGFGLPGGLLFLAEGAGYVAERRGLGQRRAELRADARLARRCRFLRRRERSRS